MKSPCCRRRRQVGAFCLRPAGQARRNLKALCGGEALPADLAAALVDCTGELWNMYGPTETTIWSTVGRVSDATETITIGRPIANTQTFILETSGQLAPAGVVGELCIGGEGVARGYRRRPELTAEKFVPVKLPDGRTVRLYRTGDLARFRGDGELELLGRRDHQVKVRGYRVELGEIEAVLADCSGVKACVVVVRAFSADDRAARCLRYFARRRSRLTPKLRASVCVACCRSTWCPPCFRAADVAADAEQQARPQRPAAAFGTGRSCEQSRQCTDDAGATPCRGALAAEVLHVDQVGLNENFFDLGGHSLLLVRLHARLKQEFATDFPLIELFQQTTVASQAERLSSIPRSDNVFGARSNPRRKAISWWKRDMSEQPLSSVPAAGDRHRRLGWRRFPDARTSMISGATYATARIARDVR